MKLLLTTMTVISLVASSQSALGSLVVASGDPIHVGSWAANFKYEGHADRIEIANIDNEAVSGRTFEGSGIEFTADAEGLAVLDRGWTRDKTFGVMGPGPTAVDFYGVAVGDSFFFRIRFPDTSWTAAPPGFEFRVDFYLGVGEETGQKIWVDGYKLTWPTQQPESVFDFAIGGQSGPPPMVPEPASMVLWTLLGACGVGFAWWRRRRAA